MSRPRSISDEEILMAATRVMERVPPRGFTLALVGKEAGLAPATLLQRFGSKLGLLQALARAGAEGMPDALVAVQAAHASPVKAIEAYLEGFAMLAPSADALNNSLAYLQQDLSEPTLRAPTQALFAAHEAALRTLLHAATRAGELVAVEPRALARTLMSVVQGTLIIWGVYHDGSLRAAIRREVRGVLRPYHKPPGIRRVGRG